MSQARPRFSGGDWFVIGTFGVLLLGGAISAVARHFYPVKSYIWWDKFWRWMALATNWFFDSVFADVLAGLILLLVALLAIGALLVVYDFLKDMFYPPS